MAVDVAKLAIQLEAQGAEAITAQLEGLGGSAASLAGMVAASVVAFEALEKSMEFLKESVNAAAEEEQVFTRMGVAVNNAGVNFEAARPAIEGLLNSLSDKSTYRVDQLGEAFTRLVQLTGNVGGSMQKLGIVADFAAGRNIDLETAAQLVGKAMNGNATQLNRQLGLHGDAAQAIAVLTERYKGNAEALADTMGGAQAQATNAMHEFEEAVGSVITKEGGAQQATLEWRDVIKSATDWVKSHRTELGNLVLGITSVVSAVGTLISWIKYPLVGAWMAVNAVIYEVIAVIENIPPTLKLMSANAGLVLANFLYTLAEMFPGLHAVLDGFIKKVAESAVKSSAEATAAINANNEAAAELTRALSEGDEPLETHTAKVKVSAQAHAQSTEELFKEAEELTKLSELRAQTGSQFVQEQNDYARLTKLVEAHTLGLADEAKAVEILAKMRKANQFISGSISLGNVEPQVDEMKDLAKLDKLVTDSIINSGKEYAKAQKKAAYDYQHSAAGEWQHASDMLADSIQNAVRDDFINLTADLAKTVTDTIGTAFTGGFAAAGKQALQGLGNILGTMGKHMMVVGAQLIGLLPALHNPFTSGPAMLAVGAILVATSGILGAIATGPGGAGGGGGGGYSVAGAGAASNAARITNITLADPGAAGAKGMSPAPAVHVTVIGSNDPTAQRGIIDLINNATGRGMALTP